MTPPAPKPAVHIRDLPRDPRGFLIPAEAPWEGDQVKINKTDNSLKVLLAAYRACAVCGFPVPPGEPVWRIYDQLSRTTTLEQIANDAITDFDVPGHLVCMLYSTQVCPYWRTGQARLAKDSVFEPGGARGTPVAIMGFTDYAVLFDATGAPSNQTYFLMEDFVEEIVFDDPVSELATRYESQRKECGGRYVAKKRRHYAPALGGASRLKTELHEAMRVARDRGPNGTVNFEGRPHHAVISGWML